MLFAKARSYLTYYLFPFTYYLPKNPAILGKGEEVKSKNPALTCRIFWLVLTKKMLFQNKFTSAFLTISLAFSICSGVVPHSFLPLSSPPRKTDLVPP